MPDPVTLNQPAQNAIPPAQTNAPDTDAAPDPRAGLGGAPPDMSSLSGLAAPSPSAGGGSPQLAPQHRTLNTVLRAVAFGLAGSAAGMGTKTPGAAAAAGVETGMGLAQRSKENTRADAAQANQTAETQSRIKFQNVQAAEATARAKMYDQQLHNMPQEFQDDHNAKTASFMKEMQDMGITPTIMADNHGAGANTALEQLTGSHGAVPHMFVLNLGDKLVGYDMSQLTGNAGIRDQVNKIAEIQGKGSNAYSPSRWGMIGKEGREQITQQSLGFFMPMPTKDNADSLLQQYKNYQQTYAQNPNADPQMKSKLDETVKMLEGSRDTFVDQKGKEAAAVEKTVRPEKVATAKAEQDAAMPGRIQLAKMEGDNRMAVEMNKKGAEEATKADKDFLDIKGKADNIKASLAAAKSGNELAASVAPLQGTLFVTTAEGVKRINETELKSVSGAGNLVQRVQGQLNKLSKGDPIPDKLKNDMAQLVDIYTQSAHKKYSQTIDSINARHGTKIAPANPDGTFTSPNQGGGAAPTQPNSTPKYTPPSGSPTAVGPNGHTIVVDGGKWVDAQTGQPIQ